MTFSWNKLLCRLFAWKIRKPVIVWKRKRLECLSCQKREALLSLLLFAFFITLLLHSLFLEIIYRLFQMRILVYHTKGCYLAQGEFLLSQLHPFHLLQACKRSRNQPDVGQTDVLVVLICINVQKFLVQKMEILIGLTFWRTLLRTILVFNFFYKKKVFPNETSKILLVDCIK